MKYESMKFSDDFDKLIEEIDIADVNDDIKDWLKEDMKVLDDNFKEVTREEEYQAVKEAIADDRMER